MTKEEKDKLIALSDLNRKDNIKYISSEAQGIAITLDSDRYAPTFCKLERAYICGRRKSEEQIAELKQRIEWLDMAIDSDIPIADKLAELEKENAELKKELKKWKDAIYADVENYDDQLTKAKELLLELYDCIPSSMADSCKETLQKVALFFKDSEVEK